MKKLMSICCIAFFIGCASSSNSINKGIDKINYIDQFKIHKYEIFVSFYDPTFGVIDKNQSFNDLDEKTKRDKWYEYLHNSALYLFTVKDNNIVIMYCCLRGNPEIQNSARFYQLEYIDTNNLILENPNLQEYKKNIIKQENITDVGGSLFENMALFMTKNGKQYVGNGVQYLGVFCRVVPYQEIKSAVSKLIIEDLKTKQ